MKKIKKIFLILNVFLAIILLPLTVHSFAESISRNKHFTEPNDWTKFQDNNTKNYIQRNIKKVFQRLKSSVTKNDNITKALQKDNLDIVKLTIPLIDLKKMNSDLPKSGKNYTDAKLTINDKKSTLVKVKYRGDNYYHWGYEKKSFTIKKEDGSRLNLINPKPSSYIADIIAFDLARKEGLYTPKAKFIGLFINNKYQGIFQETEEIDTNYITKNELDFIAIFQGENISESHRSGPPLFLDPYKWNIAAGYSKEAALTPLLETINNENAQKIISFFDYDYLLRFYTYVSLIQNSHFDSAHNWFIGQKKNGLFYPVVWDPVGWVMNYGSGEGVEEMKFVLTEKLRKNVYFNRDFVNNLWKVINDNSLETWLFSSIDKNKDSLSDNLKYDFFGGGVWDNPNGTRAHQPPKSVLLKIQNLKDTINTRYKFIKQKLSGSSAEYYTENEFLYIKYSAISNAFIQKVYKTQNLPPSSSLQVYNKFSFSSNPYSSFEIFSGREKGRGGLPYAQICPIVYRIKIDPSSEIKPVLTHSLTREKIPIKKTKGFPLTDCMMDFSRPNPSLSQSQPNSNDELSTPPPNDQPSSFHLQLPNINPHYYLDQKKREDTGTVIFQDTRFEKVKFKKGALRENLRLSFSEKKLFGRDRFLLIPKNIQNDYFGSLDQSKNNQLLTPTINQEINLFINNFFIGHYVLIENPDSKSFFETQGFTFDTDIYESISPDTNDIENWEKISSDPHLEENELEPLEKLFHNLEKNDLIENYLDTKNLQSLLSFLKETGNEYPDYLIYFDNTQGKFLFFPNKYPKYSPSPNYQIKDPLLLKITNKLSKKKRTPSKPLPWKNKLFTLNGQRLSIEEGVYTITEDIIIPPGYQVIINPGVKLFLKPGVSIISYSKVSAKGTANKPIMIGPDKKKPWGVFAVLGPGANDSNFQYFKVTGGSEAYIDNIYLSGQLSIYHANVTLDNCTFKKAQADDSLNIKYSTNSSITNSFFKNNSADAIDFDYVSGQISNNFFENNGNDSIDISGSTVSIFENTIKNSGDKCISIGEKSYPTITKNTLDNCQIGVEVKDESQAKLIKNIISNNKIGINAYQKKEFFGSSQVDAYQTTFFQNETDYDFLNTFTGNKFESDNSQIKIH